MRGRGFTLIEILLAILILGLVLSTVYAAYTGTFRIIRDAGQEAEIYGMARTTLDRLSRDLQSLSPWRGAFVFRTPVQSLDGQEFTRLVFRSAAHVAFGDGEAPGGIAMIEYRLREGEEGGEGEEAGYTLVRDDSPARDPDREETGEASAGGYPLCRRVASLTYLFFDEAGRAHERWDAAGNLEEQRKRAPALVEIRLNLVNAADRERPYRFLTRVRLPFNRLEAP